MHVSDMRLAAFTYSLISAKVGRILGTTNMATALQKASHPSDIATVNFDRSGTTVIGKYLLNHSFMLPGLVHVVVATIAGYGISSLYHFAFGLY